MTEKRFILKSDYDWWGVIDTTDEIKGEYSDCFSTDDVVDLLNQLSDENEQLKTQLQNTSDQRNEFHRGARENANRVGKLEKENEQLKSDLKDCKKLKGKRLRKIRNHRAVIEELGGVIKAYKGKLSQANEKIEKIKEAMEDTGALTKRQLEEILK